MPGATMHATRSGEAKAIRLGTNSPMIRDRYVMTVTTIPTPASLAIVSGTPSSGRTEASRVPIVAPENAPARTPTRVIPICTVERNRPGSRARFNAMDAPRSPRSARSFRRPARDETIASSDIARTPFKPTIRNTRTISSSMIKFQAESVSGTVPWVPAAWPGEHGKNVASGPVSIHLGNPWRTFFPVALFGAFCGTGIPQARTIHFRGAGSEKDFTGTHCHFRIASLSSLILLRESTAHHRENHMRDVLKFVRPL